jgi:3-dehydroquinate dehydratase-2
MKSILVIHGPNLKRLGEREVGVYGTMSLEELDAAISQWADEHGIPVTIVQANSEGSIIDAVESARDRCRGIVINPAAYTHYSHAIGDAIRGSAVPVVEVHLTNIFSREDFRSTTVTAPGCRGVICGFGKLSYLLAMEALAASGRTHP